MTPPIQLGEEPHQGDEVLDAEGGPSGSEDEEWVRALDVGPAGRHRAHALLARLPEEDAVLAPGVGEADQVVLPTEQRMDRGRDAEALRLTPKRKPIP